MTSSFCGKCGAALSGAFCTRCGSSTSHVEPGAHSVDVLASHPGADAVDRRAGASVLAVQPAPGDPSIGAPGGSVRSDHLLDGLDRHALGWETTWVMTAFLVPVVVGAVLLLVEHISGVAGITRFPEFVTGHPVTNLVLGILDYLAVMALVPLALLLLARTGQSPSALGLAAPGLFSDVFPGLGLAAAAFVSEIVILIPLAPVIAHHQSLISKVPVGHVPSYYVVWGLAISAITAVTEEVLMNGYLITRLDQLGWSPAASATLAIVLRTSYHVYYGLGFLLTIPFSFFVTRSFQKHGRLMRPIVAHFLFDGVLITIAILR